MTKLNWFSLAVSGVMPLALFMGCSTSSDHMGTTMMGSSGLGPIWYYWLIPLSVLLLVAWIVTRFSKRNRGPRE
jgi:hypothetical protein